MPSVQESLNAALHGAMTRDERVIVLGEDILDPYGGAFKVTRGLSEAFPGRVLTTPISEAGFVGLATGMALRGLRPVVEIMFGDFVTLIADQVINHAAKFGWMYSGGKPEHEKVRVPLVIRTPMGGRRGYGPTHSQSLEKLYLGVPGLRALAPCALGKPGKLLRQAILKNEDPVLFVENKLLYPLPVQGESALAEFEVREMLASQQGEGGGGLGAAYAPTYTLRVRGGPAAQITLAAYGHMADLARQAAQRLAYEEEVFVETVVPTQLAPFDVEAILASVERTGRLLVAEEGSLSLGWGAEVVARAAEALGGRLKVARRVAARELPVPASRALEEVVLPGVEDIIRSAQKMV